MKEEYKNCLVTILILICVILLVISCFIYTKIVENAPKSEEKGNDSVQKSELINTSTCKHIDGIDNCEPIKVT